jgi:hypothetical protein
MGKYRDWLAANGKDAEAASLDQLESARRGGYKGWLTGDNVPATRENTDAAVWEALQTPFRRPGDPRNPR